ncbi:MAG TPA: alanine racemase [Terriglobales bacterium]|nr:alanine racemase [Terriglobales bacterium]
MPTRPTWAEVSLSALTHNFKILRDFVAPHATICAVVKCDAYGHGAVECARALESAGAEWFGVTCSDEGIELRRAGIAERILLMSGMWRGEAEAIIEHNLTPAVWNAEQIEELNTAAAKTGRSAFPVHIEVDTGMSRQGVQPYRLAVLLEAARKAKLICLEGLHSHLASAEVVDAADVEDQTRAYQQALQQLAAAGMRPACLHLANSAAIVAHKETWHSLDQNGKQTTVLVRPGIALYGYSLPFVTSEGEDSGTAELPLQPVLSWKTRIIDLREVEPGQGVGYNLTHTASRRGKIATIAVGYGDGLSRGLSNRGRVLVRGALAPIVGKVSMDVTTIDVSEIPGAAAGDEVVLIGSVGRRRLTAWDMADVIGTIPYEVLCNIGKRVPRIFASTEQ